MFNIGETLRIDIVMVVRTHTIQKGYQMWSCVEYFSSYCGTYKYQFLGLGGS